MRSITSHNIYRHKTELFQNKCEAMALKRVVKACFAPQFIYEQSQQPKSNHVQENGPSFISSNCAKPQVDRSLRCSTKAFVSKKLKHNICELLKKQISNVREETRNIDDRLRNVHQPTFKEMSSSFKNSSRSTTNRSFNQSQPKRILFKLNS